MKKSVILIYPDEIFKRKSGSGIRPGKVFGAFKSLGYQTFLLTGALKNRKQAFTELKRVLLTESFEFVYFENLSRPLTARAIRFGSFLIPFFNWFDIYVLIFLKLRGIPIIYYVRDLHWMYPSIFGKKLSRFQKLYLQIMGQIEMLVIRLIADQVYCPSSKFAELVTEKFGIPAAPLSPGSDMECKIHEMNVQKINMLFVGGTGYLYDPRIFLDGLKNSSKSNFELMICTRLKKWNDFMSGVETPSFVKIIDGETADLSDLYASADICVHYSAPNEYIQISHSVKIAEYICAGKPIFIFSGNGASEMIYQSRLGWVVDCNRDAVTAWVDDLMANLGEIELYRNNVIHHRMGHTWDAVVKRIETQYLARRLRAGAAVQK